MYPVKLADRIPAGKGRIRELEERIRGLDRRQRRGQISLFLLIAILFYLELYLIFRGVGQ